MTTMTTATDIQARTEKLERYRTTLDKLIEEEADKRAIGSWKSRITKLEKELVDLGTGDNEEEHETGAAAQEPTDEDQTDEQFIEGENRSAPTKEDVMPTGTKEKTKAKTTGTPPSATEDGKGRKGTLYCMCGCGNANNPGSKFSMGHDARLKSVLSKVDKGTEGGSTIPASTVVDVQANKGLSVGPFSSADIIRLSKKAAPKVAAK